MTSPRLFLVLALLFSGFVPAWAADRDLDPNTILFVSTDNMAEYRAGLAASQAGALMNDPKIAKLTHHLKQGVISMLKQQISSETAGATEAQKKAVAELTQWTDEYLTAIWEKVNGRFSFSLGYREQDGMMEPEMMLHYQGGEELAALHTRFVDIVKRATEGELSAVEEDIQGVHFVGLAFPGAAMPPIKQPDGLFFGNKGSDYYVGISKAGLGAYIGAQGSGTTGTARLGSTPFFQKATAAVKDQSARVFLNLDPIWKLLPMAAGAGPQGAMAIQLIQSLGLTDLQGLYSGGVSGAAGQTAETFIGLQGRRGLLQVVPESGALAVPMSPFVPADVLSAEVIRLRLDGLYALVEGIAGQFGGPQAMEEMTRELAPVEGMLGVTVKELVGNLEGTLMVWGRASPGGIGMMAMGGGMPPLCVGLKVKDSALVQRALSALSANEQAGAMIRVENHLDHKVYTFDPSGGRGGGMGPMPMPSATVADGWLLFGMSSSDLKGALDSAATGKNLASSEGFKKLSSSVSAGNMGVAYVDLGETLAGFVDGLKMMLGFAAMGLPDEVFSNSDLMYVLSPQNFPSGDLMRKYFGKSIGSTGLVDGGIRTKSWMPNPVVKPTPESAGNAGK